MKHYVSSQSIGRIAGVRDRLGAHFYTDSAQEQRRIESHPLFKRGIIQIADDTPISTDVEIEKLSWNDLKALAKERGIQIFGKKRAQVLEELNAADASR